MFPQPVPRHVSGAGVGQGGLPGRRFGHSSPAPAGTRARPSGDGWARQWGSGAGNIPWPVLLICITVALVSQHSTAFNGFTHPSIPVGWGSAALPLGLRGKNTPVGTLKGRCGSREAFRSRSLLVSQPPVPAPGLKAPWDSEDEPAKEMCTQAGWGCCLGPHRARRGHLL